MDLSLSGTFLVTHTTVNLLTADHVYLDRSTRSGVHKMTDRDCVGRAGQGGRYVPRARKTCTGFVQAGKSAPRAAWTYVSLQRGNVSRD